MIYSNKPNKTIIVALEQAFQREWCIEVLEKGKYRVLKASSLVKIAELLYQYHVDLIISNSDIRGISLIELIPLLNRFYKEIKVAVFMKEYSAEEELLLRLNGVSYTIPWPVTDELMLSVVNRGTDNKIAYAV